MSQGVFVQVNRIKGGPLFRNMDIRAGSVDAEKRTATLLVSSGAQGKRSSWFGDDWMEELAIAPGAIRMDRLQSGAPLLANHDSYSLDSVLGVVERAYIQDGNLMADVRFSNRADADAVFQDVAAGIVRNVSVGYRVHKWEDVTPDDESIKAYRAVDWEPYEVSLVPMGFDAAAQVRSSGFGGEFDMEVITKRAAPAPQARKIMADETKPAGETKPQVDEAAIRAAAAAEAVKAERQRAADIETAVKASKLGDEFARDLIAKGVSVEKARELIIEAWAKKGDEIPAQRSGVQVGDQDDRQTRAAGMVSALMHRCDPTRFKLEGRASEFRGLSVVEMARDHLDSQGVKTRGMSRAEVISEAFAYRAGGANSTSDFPNILAAVPNKILLSGYEQLAARQTFRPLTKTSYAPDFKNINFTRLGEMPKLELTPEGGQIKRGTLGDTKEVVALGTYTKGFTITREALINDDLNAFSDLPAKFGFAAARLESDVWWSIVTANAAMSDSVALFHATHGNLAASGAVISVTTLGAGRAAMMTQKGLSKNDPLNIVAKYLVVPAALQTQAEQFVTSAMLANQPTSTNPFAGRLQPIAEARLDVNSTTAWYLFADPMDGVDTIQIVYLEGQPGPKVEQRVGWDVNGIEIKVTHDVAAKSIDYRGVYKNAGA